MKSLKIALFALVAVFALSFATQSFADSIGFVDMEKISVNYKEAKKVQDELQQKRLEYQKIFEEKQKEVETARRKGKKDEEIQKMIDKIEGELKPKQESMLKYEAEKQRTLLSKIVEVSKKTAKEYGIDTVLDKRVVYAGGFDLTDFVLEKLNK
ncbi:MAG: OmpH family outer membrane protein [Candidatus Margulisiibacteriota bacterium]